MLCLVVFISSYLVSVPVYASDSTPVVRSYYPFNYNFSDVSLQWFQGTSSPTTSSGIIFNTRYETGTLGSTKTFSASLDFPYDMYHSSGVAVIKGKYMDSSSYSPFMHIEIPLMPDYTYTAGYSLTGSLAIGALATYPYEPSPITKGSVISYIECNGVYSYPASDGLCYINFSEVVPDSHLYSLQCNVYFNTVSYADGTLYAGTYSYDFDFIAKSNLVYREYPSEYKLVASNGTTSGWVGDTDLPSPDDPVSSPSTGPSGGTDLSGVEQGIKDVGDKVDEVQDAIKQQTEETKKGFGAIIEAITNLPKLILDGIIHLFVPTQEEIQELVAEYDELFKNKLGFVAQVGSIIGDIFDGIFSALNIADDGYVFKFPGISFPMNGTTYQLVPPQDVSLDNALFRILRPVAGTITIILCLIAILNMASRLFEAVFITETGKHFWGDDE